MKPIAAFQILIFLLIGLSSTAQSTELTINSYTLISDFHNEGWSLLDEGNYMINNNRTLILDERVYQKDKQYTLVALIDDCKSCPISVRFGQKGQTPNKLKDLKAALRRFPKTSISSLAFEVSPKENTTGYLMIFSTSTIRRYAYAMLFVKDK